MGDPGLQHRHARRPGAVKHSQPLLRQEQTHYHERPRENTPRPFRISRVFPRQVTKRALPEATASATLPTVVDASADCRRHRSRRPSVAALDRGSVRALRKAQLDLELADARDEQHEPRRLRRRTPPSPDGCGYPTCRLTACVSSRTLSAVNVWSVEVLRKQRCRNRELPRIIPAVAARSFVSFFSIRREDFLIGGSFLG